jgi:hypothetical protein
VGTHEKKGKKGGERVRVSGGNGGVVGLWEEIGGGGQGVVFYSLGLPCNKVIKKSIR